MEPEPTARAAPSSTLTAEVSEAMRDYASALGHGRGNFSDGAGRLAYKLLVDGLDQDEVRRRIAEAAVFAARDEQPLRELAPSDAWERAAPIVAQASDALDAELRQQERLRRAQEHVEHEGAARTAAELGGHDITAHFQRPSELESRPVEWIVDGLVPAGMLMLLHATDKAGKTLLAWEIARSVVAGLPFLARPGFAGFPVRRGRVVLALLDDAAPINAFRRDLFGLAAFDDDVLLMTEYPEHNGMPVAPNKVLSMIDTACATFLPALVVLDALYLFIATSHDAGNDAARMKLLMQIINRLTRRGVAVVLIAHDRKDEDDVAGSYVIRAAAKQRLHLQKYPLRQPPRDGVPREKDSGKRILRVTGKLGGEALHALMLRPPGRFEYVSDDLEAARATWNREREESTQTTVMKFFEAGNEGTVEAVTQAVGRRREDVFGALKALVSDGYLEPFKMSKLPGVPGRAPTGYRLRNDDADPGEEAHEGTISPVAGNSCGSSPGANGISFRGMGSTRNEIPVAESLEPSRGTQSEDIVPSSPLSLGDEAPGTSFPEVPDEGDDRDFEDPGEPTCTCGSMARDLDDLTCTECGRPAA